MRRILEQSESEQAEDPLDVVRYSRHAEEALVDHFVWIS